MATTLELYEHASASAQRDAVNLLEDQLFPSWRVVEILRRKNLKCFSKWSGRPDLNRGPPAPKASAETLSSWFV